ncbi:MAG: endonuclease V [Verrucomicrobiales bacterium]|nr:endonuclease V [Verrucomicrobiales bacterium]MCP5526316.1 endonuclease V [Verrucomicrobiales bacterium]
MKFPRPPHAWTLSPVQAVAVQRQLALGVRFEALSAGARWIAGLDAAFTPDRRQCVGAVVLWDREQGVAVESHVARRPLRFPYVPGLLSFREAPALLAAVRRLKQTPDVLLADGHGLAHPRRFGIACHLGVLCDLPSIGCAKSRLIGAHDEPGLRRGDRSFLYDQGETIGTVLRTREGTRPLFISVGHRADLEGAVALVLACGAGFRLPEPTRLADRLVARARAGR